MGDILAAQCECGFYTEIAAGGGKMDFQTYCGAPALCTDCGQFAALNWLDKDVPCPACGGEIRFYDDPALRSRSNVVTQPGSPVFSWNARGGFTLPDNRYYCPDCQEMRMRFDNIGCWD
ncbi:MAG TPA: hypothetical protein PKE64_20450 [Anaerolineae bacterium]|nr:hypothetical protein [Anaerolineae bacterium]